MGNGTAETVGCRILVAEDDGALRASLVDLLSSDDHQVLQAADGQAAVDLLEEHAFDVLVLDMHMPKLDGLAVLDRIEGAPPRVIVYSAFAYYEQRSLQEQLGWKVVQVLRKPVPPHELISAVESACPKG
ncbi:MAG TPA: response regulator [Acidimicrobiales bacterium]|nr:response regulator [Acidimicrobiales bacterium]